MRYNTKVNFQDHAWFQKLMQERYSRQKQYFTLFTLIAIGVLFLLCAKGMLPFAHKIRIRQSEISRAQQISSCSLFGIICISNSYETIPYFSYVHKVIYHGIRFLLLYGNHDLLYFNNIRKMFYALDDCFARNMSRIRYWSLLQLSTYIRSWFTSVTVNRVRIYPSLYSHKK